MLIGCDSINNEREVGFWVIVLAWWYAWYCVVLFLFTLVSFISGVWVYVCHICVSVCLCVYQSHFPFSFPYQFQITDRRCSCFSFHVKCLSWMTPPTDMIWLQQKVLNDQETATTPLEQNRSVTKMMKTKATKMTMKATTAKSKLKIKTRFKRISHVNVLRWTYDARSRKNMHESSQQHQNHHNRLHRHHHHRRRTVWEEERDQHQHQNCYSRHCCRHHHHFYFFPHFHLLSLQLSFTYGQKQKMLAVLHHCERILNEHVFSFLGGKRKHVDGSQVGNSSQRRQFERPATEKQVWWV